ncbi:MAG: hypothetical protein PUC16_06890, partial [Bacteroidales bacterium]|nr:hypothetical protein [Bacteroidales bacterium]
KQKRKNATEMTQKRNRFSTKAQKSKKIALDFQALAKPKMENMKRRFKRAKRRFVCLKGRFTEIKRRFCSAICYFG